MKKDYISELRDRIALEALPVLLNNCEHLEYSQITELCYEIAEEMLISRNKHKSILNNNKE